jgi:hypothetical protein
VLVVAIWYSRPARFGKARFEKTRFGTNAWALSAAWGTGAAFVMLPASNLLWEYLPKFRFVQLPFRWLLCINAALAILLAIATSQSAAPQPSIPRSAITRSAITRWAARALVSVILLFVLVLAGHRIQPPWWDTSGDIAEMEDAISDEIGYEGTDEYVPVGADPSEVKKDLPPVSDSGGTAASVQMLEWDATEKHFVAHTDSAENVTVRLFNYPAWKVIVNGKPAATETSEVTGLMVIPLPAGENDVQINFGRTSDRLVGGLVSGISVILFGVAWIMTKPKPQSPNIARADA